jgi:hypothetical protein
MHKAPSSLEGLINTETAAYSYLLVLIYFAEYFGMAVVQ